MHLKDVLIQFVSVRQLHSTMLAVVLVAAGKVNVLNVVLCVDLLAVDLAAERAAELAPLRALANSTDKLLEI